MAQTTHDRLLGVVDKLMIGDPPPDSASGMRLERLASALEQYERGAFESLQCFKQEDGWYWLDGEYPDEGSYGPWSSEEDAFVAAMSFTAKSQSGPGGTEENADD